MELNKLQFNQQIKNSQLIIKQILNINKKNYYSEEISLKFPNKYEIINYLINLWIASSINLLLKIGLKKEILKEIKEKKDKKRIILRFESIEKCFFLQEIERIYDTNNQLVINYKKDYFTFSKYKTVKEYEWKYQLNYEINLQIDRNHQQQQQQQEEEEEDLEMNYDSDQMELEEEEEQQQQEQSQQRGEEVSDKIILNSLSCQHIVSIITNTTFRPEVKILPPIDLDLTWLLQHISFDDFSPIFSINKNHRKCFTPCRNLEVKQALKSLQEINKWIQEILIYFKSEIFPLQIHYPLTNIPLPNISLINSNGIFNPIISIYIQEEEEEEEFEENYNE